jgi:hypothetical protein
MEDAQTSEVDEELEAENVGPWSFALLQIFKGWTLLIRPFFENEKYERGWLKLKVYN